MIKINKINMEVQNLKENIKQKEKIQGRKTKTKCVAVAKRTEISKPMDMSKRKNRKRKSGE